MPHITRQHPEYKKYLPKWIRQRDVVEGEDAVKDKGEVYLPRLDGQATGFKDGAGIAAFSSYDAYKNRASLLNMTKRTRDSLLGAILRKDAVIEWPQEADPLLERVGRSKETLYEIQHMAISEALGIGRLGILADAPSMAGGDPYLAIYSAEAITDWDTAVVGDRIELVRVVLKEKRIVELNEEEREVTRYRRLLLTTEIEPEEDDDDDDEGPEYDESADDEDPELTPETAVYVHEVWDEVITDDPEEDKLFTLTSSTIPQRNGGTPLNYIPFVFINAADTGVNPCDPMLQEIALLDLSIYRNTADLEHGLHFTALPQPWISGFKFEGQLFIGSSMAWIAEDPNARAGYLEFQGTGLKAISDRIEQKKKEAAMVGARLLEKQPDAGGNEAFETVKLRHNGERSALANLSIAVSEALTRCLRYLADFKYGGTVNKDEVMLALNTDFGTEGMSPQMLQSMMQQVMNGTLSWDTFFWNVKRADMVPDSRTIEEEKTMIEAGRPETPAPPQAAVPNLGGRPTAKPAPK